MTGYDWDRPYIKQEDMALFEAIDPKISLMYGRNVKATELSNIEYKRRFEKFNSRLKMHPPPSCGRIFPGYLVIRRLGTPHQYETWMPDHVFDELYKKQSQAN